MSARVARNSLFKTADDSSSESSIESLDKMAETIQKYLGQKDADDVKRIVNDINSAKDSEQSVDSYVSLDTFCRMWFIWRNITAQYLLWLFRFVDKINWAWY